MSTQPPLNLSASDMLDQAPFWVVVRWRQRSPALVVIPCATRAAANVEDARARRAGMVTELLDHMPEPDELAGRPVGPGRLGTTAALVAIIIVAAVIAWLFGQ